MMYRGWTRVDTMPIRYQPIVKNSVAVIMVNAAAIKMRPPVACHDHTAHAVVQTGSHHLAA